MIEIRPVKGYEGLYEIDENGNVYSLSRKKYMAQHKMKKGYMRVALCKNGKLKHLLVHRLVAEAFIDNPNNLPQVNHKDENKTNNRKENLEWCDSNYNINYGTGRKRAVEKVRVPVIAERLADGKVTEYEGIRVASRELNVPWQTICAVLKGKQKQTYGYVFRYERCD